MDKLLRVFYHELGHFVANELNFKYFKGPQTENIFIYSCGKYNEELCGVITKITPYNDCNEDNKSIPLNRLPSVLIGLIYGCIFQSYYSKKELIFCLNQNGFNDMDSHRSALNQHQIYDEKVLRDIFDEYHLYFNGLIENNTLEEFMKIDLNLYKINLEGKYKYSINISKLREDTQDIVKNHSKDYLAIVDKIDDIISN